MKPSIGQRCRSTRTTVFLLSLLLSLRNNVSADTIHISTSKHPSSIPIALTLSSQLRTPLHENEYDKSSVPTTPASGTSVSDEESYAWIYRRAVVVGSNSEDTLLPPDHDTEPGQGSSAQRDKVISDSDDNKDSNKDGTKESVTRGNDDNETTNKQEKEHKAEEEADRKAAEEEAAKKEKEEADRKAKEEAERTEREETEQKAREEAEQKAKEDAEQKAKEDAEQKAKEDAEQKAKEDAEQKAKEEAEQKAKDEADQKAREEREQREREEQARKKAQEEVETRDKFQRDEPESQNEKDSERIKAENAAEEQRRKEEAERESSRNNGNESTGHLDDNGFSRRKGSALPTALVASISAGAVVLASIVAALILMYRRQAHRRSNALNAFLCRKVELYPIHNASGSISRKGGTNGGTTNDHSFYNEEIALSMAQQPPSHQSPPHRHVQTYPGDDDLLLVHSNDNVWATPMPPLMSAFVPIHLSVDAPRSHHHVQRQQHTHGQYMKMSPEMVSYDLPVHLQGSFNQNQNQSYHIQDGYTMKPPPSFHAYYEHSPIESTLIVPMPQELKTPSEPTPAALSYPLGNPSVTTLLSEPLDPIMGPRLPQFEDSISQDSFVSPRRTVSCRIDIMHQGSTQSRPGPWLDQQSLRR